MRGGKAAPGRHIGGGARWGTEPYRIGLWVGGAVSPNWYGDAAEQVAEVRESGGIKRTGVLQTLSCPWCGTKLVAHRDLRADDDRGGSCCTALLVRDRTRARSRR